MISAVCLEIVLTIADSIPAVQMVVSFEILFERNGKRSTSGSERAELGPLTHLSCSRNNRAYGVVINLIGSKTIEYYVATVYDSVVNEVERCFGFRVKYCIMKNNLPLCCSRSNYKFYRVALNSNRLYIGRRDTVSLHQLNIVDTGNATVIRIRIEINTEVIITCIFRIEISFKLSPSAGNYIGRVEIFHPFTSIHARLGGDE